MNDPEAFMSAAQTAIDKSVAETVKAFLNNPSQFHGDTGIMHYLYHRMMTHGHSFVFKQCNDDVRVLLLQSEHYTSLKYLHGGQAPSGGRLDFAIINPESVSSDGRVTEDAAALIGFEVGRNKALDKMGEFRADRMQDRVKPGDAAKIIRELRFGQMVAGYILEFYTERQRKGDANHVFDQIKAAAEDLHVAGLHMVSVVASERPDHGWVSLYPAAWEERLGIESQEPPPPPPPPSGGGLQKGGICEIAGQGLVVIIGRGDNNCRVKRMGANELVDTVGKSFKVSNDQLVPQGRTYHGQLHPRTGEHYKYQGKVVIVVGGGTEQSRVKWRDGTSSESFKVYNHELEPE